MPTYQQLPGQLQVQITTLFTPRNFCFFTSVIGRTPTFYFARGGVAQLSTATLCGRLRTMHTNGPLIDITTSSKRHFFFQSLDDRERVRAFMNLTRNTVHRTNGNCRLFMERVGQVYGTTPQNWHYHYEYTVPNGQPNRVRRTHPSGGRVHLTPRPTQTQAQRLIDRLLADNCAVEVDRHVQVPRGVPVNRVAILNATNYLNSL